MSKYFNFKSIALFFLIIFFMCSCSSNNKTSTNADPVPEGYFDDLYIGRKAFVDLPERTKIVFCHKFATDNKVHLDGWVLGDGSGFKTPPDMPLINGDPSTVKYGADIYFGNVVIHRDEFDKIRNALINQPNKQFVVFKPRPRDAGDHHISYDIFVRVLSSFKIKEADDVRGPIAEANPSPPKNYTD